MSISPVSGLSTSYLQSLMSMLGPSSSTSRTSGNTSGVNALGTSTQDSNQMSPFAQMLATLQQLQQSNPTQYAQVTGQISTNLTAAAKTAQSEGNTSAASQLNQLAADFSGASTSGQLPNIQDLAQAVGGHHHHHHAHGGASSTSGSSATTASGSTNESLQQLFGSIASGSTANDAFDPMSIISTTLSNAGLTSTT
jgi:hypothetical protein